MPAGKTVFSLRLKHGAMLRPVFMLGNDRARGPVADFKIAESPLIFAFGISEHPHCAGPRLLAVTGSGGNAPVVLAAAGAVHPEQLDLAPAPVDEHDVKGIPIRL